MEGTCSTTERAKESPQALFPHTTVPHAAHTSLTQGLHNPNNNIKKVGRWSVTDLDCWYSATTPINDTSQKVFGMSTTDFL
jgi:hypothetical protein